MSRKQLKITKMFKKVATPVAPEDDCDCEELEEEIAQLESTLRQKQNELFQLLRHIYRAKLSYPKKEDEMVVRPENIILQNSTDGLKKKIDLMTMLTGMEVQSYISGEHCCVVFHVQNTTQHQVSHGLRIEMKSGKNEVTSCSMPLGFNLATVLDEYTNVMQPQCLRNIRRALVAYYDRLEQFSKLKKLLNVGGELFKTLDGTHIEISIQIQGEEEYEEGPEHFPLTIMLDYRVYDIRPKTYSILEIDLPEGAPDKIRQQCAVFKKKELHKAFKVAFLEDIGPYGLVQQMGLHESDGQPPTRKRFRPNKQRHNDDTFLPEDCSDQGDDDEYH